MNGSGQAYAGSLSGPQYHAQEHRKWGPPTVQEPGWNYSATPAVSVVKVSISAPISFPSVPAAL